MKIVTSLSFQGECREAFDFYAKVLGGKVTAFAFRDAPGESPVDPKYQDWLMHAWLEFGDQALMGADMPPQFGGEPQAGVSISVTRQDEGAARGLFDTLADGGRTIMPYGPTFFAKGFGMCTDRFGTSWMISHGMDDCQEDG